MVQDLVDLSQHLVDSGSQVAAVVSVILMILLDGVALVEVALEGKVLHPILLVQWDNLVWQTLVEAVEVRTIVHHLGQETLLSLQVVVVLVSS
tara:strand:+ start:384 stop:662 length:279 start_codon:yes stop_codon:yes gene_type:complete